MTSKEKIIYGLVDPNLNKIRYVGRSSSGLWRPNAHRYPSRLSRGQTHCECRDRHDCRYGISFTSSRI